MDRIMNNQARKQLAILENLSFLEQLPELDNAEMSFPLVQAPVVPMDGLAHTPEHRDCPACRAFDALLQVERKNIAGLTFAEARLFWTARRQNATGIRAATRERDDAYMEALAQFFAPMRLRDITPGHLRAYQISRAQNSMRVAGEEAHPWKHPATNSTINHELALLGRVLTHCRLWKNLREYYFPLPVPRWSPRSIMEEDEEADFFLRGISDPRARLAYLVACLTNNTTASGAELRFMRLRHLFLRPAGEISEIYIPPEGCKNETRPRKIALNRTALWAVGQLYTRALQLGCADPDDFLFPFRIHRGKYDPTRPASKTFLRKSWQRLRAVTGRVDLRPHDLRHHCITRLLENGEDPETVRAIAGHLRPEMTEYYSHQRRRVKFAALEKIDRPAPKPVARA